MQQDFQILYQKIDYTFKKKALLKAALTHRSVAGDNNERLEFLGDSLLNCIIAQMLFQKYPQLKEGELSRLRASLVKGETLAKIANDLEISRFILLGPGEVRTGGAKRESILADTVEAIIGAIYIDADFEICKQCVLNWFSTRIDTIHLGSDFKDPKTSLQEHLQAKHIPVPSYQVIKITGQAHEQEFTVLCEIPLLKLKAMGTGKSRRKAEQQAATIILERLNVG